MPRPSPPFILHVNPFFGARSTTKAQLPLSRSRGASLPARQLGLTRRRPLPLLALLRRLMLQLGPVRHQLGLVGRHQRRTRVLLSLPAAPGLALAVKSFIRRLFHFIWMKTLYEKSDPHLGQLSGYIRWHPGLALCLLTMARLLSLQLGKQRLRAKAACHSAISLLHAGTLLCDGHDC